jgi:murein DD-endopeptidase MepM/ murein hydrolase activator NlpD
MRLSRPALAALLTAVLLVGSGFAAAADEHDAAYQQVVDITFPTAAASARTPIRSIDGTSYGFMDDYAHGRSNTCGIHRATDIFGPHGQPIYAAAAGSITYMPDPAPSWGWMIRIAGDDGRQYNYIHLGRDDGPREDAYAPGLSVGDRVSRGQLIGYLGSSGNASESLPHLHFEIRDDDVADSNQWNCPYINPYYSLKAAVERDDLAPEDPPGAGESNPEGGGLPEATVDRVSGPDRVATAIALARTAHDRAGTVVLAPARSFPEAAAAGPLAAALDGAVLLTWPDMLDSRAAAEINRLEADKVVLVGGLEELGDRVVAELVSKAGIAPENIRRIAGRDAFATAAAVAKEVWAVGGRERRGQGTAAEAQSLLRRFMEDEVDMNASRLVAADGSGLSTLDRITGRHMIGLLDYAHSAPWGTTLHASLPVAGQSELLRRRMKLSPADGNLHAKTGTTNAVMSLAGYVTSENGEVIAFSFVYNGSDRWNARSTMDVMGETLAGFARP